MHLNLAIDFILSCKPYESSRSTELLEDENGTLFEPSMPELGAGDDKLLETLAAPPETTPQAAVTGGGAFKFLI